MIAAGARGAAVLAAAIVLAAPAAAAQIAGAATVIDAGTLEIGGSRLRLFGIDAPRLGQRCEAGGRDWPCGRLAALELSARIGGRPLHCAPAAPEAAAAICRPAGGGEALGLRMLGDGWGLAAARAPGAYRRAEQRARAHRRGIWRGGFAPTAEWRRAAREPPAADAPALGGCDACSLRHRPRDPVPAK